MFVQTHKESLGKEMKSEIENQRKNAIREKKDRMK
jgi:hypothetical protein